MKIESFIYRRLIANKKYKHSVSAPILRIGVLSIAVGMVVMLIAVATGKGLEKKIKTKITGFNGAVQMLNIENASALNVSEPITYNSELKRIINQNQEVKHIQVFANKSGIIKTTTDFEGVVLKGVGQDYDWSFFKDYLVEGTLPSYDSVVSNAVLLSKTIADKLTLKTGDFIVLWFVRNEFEKPPLFRKLEIKGLFNTGFPDFDNNFVVGDIRHIQKLNKWQPNEVGGLELSVKHFSKIEAVNEALYNNSPQGIATQSVFSVYPNIFNWVAMFDSNIIMIIAIMVLIAGFNMISVILVLILEQTPTIGMLKAMGATNAQVRKIFLYQATYLIARGLFWGNLIGIGLLLIQKIFKVIQLNPETYNVRVVPVYLNPMYIILLNLGVIALTYLMMILPSLYINKVSPVKAIKFD